VPAWRPDLGISMVVALAIMNAPLGAIIVALVGIGTGCAAQGLAGDRRRRGEVAPRTLARVGQLRLPKLFARILVERNGPSVDRANVNPPVRDGDAAAVRCEEDLIHDVVEFGIVVPEFLSSRRVGRKYSIIRGDGVHYSVDHQWRLEETLEDSARLVDPGDVKFLHIW